jgi:hypothetical protein
MAETETHKVTLIPGDGFGPEVSQAAQPEPPGLRMQCWRRWGRTGKPRFGDGSRAKLAKLEVRR